MEIRSHTLFRSFFYKMSSVAGGIKHHVVAAAGNISFKNAFQRIVVVIIGIEGKVINKENKFQRVILKGLNDIGNLRDSAFAYFDESDAFVKVGGGAGFYG